VFVVDDHPAVRDAFVAMFASAGLETRGFASGQDFLDDFRETPRSCLVLDLRLSDMSGLELQGRLLARRIDLPIVFLTGHGDIATAVRAIKAGAVDFLEKPVPHELLLRSVQRALALDRADRLAASARDEFRERLARLSPRERQVLDLLVEGNINSAMAAKLGVATKTIEFHRANVLAKLQVGSSAEAIRMTLQYSAKPSACAHESTTPSSAAMESV
jgi:FixJ family two-component response regulator